MYFQKRQFLGEFRPFLQRSLAKSTVASNCQQLCKSPHTIFFHDFLISVSMQCPKIGTTLEITRRKNGFVLFLAFSAQYTEPGRQCRICRYVLVTLCGGTNQALSDCTLLIKSLILVTTLLSSLPFQLHT